MERVMANGRRPGTGGPSTTERGLGYKHQQARRTLLASLDPDALCAYCRKPLGDDPDRLDLDHAQARVLGGQSDDWNYRLTHRSCNRAAGARLGNRRRAGSSSDPRPSHFSASWDELRCSGCSCDLPRSRCKAVA